MFALIGCQKRPRQGKPEGQIQIGSHNHIANLVSWVVRQFLMTVENMAELSGVAITCHEIVALGFS